MNPDAFLPDLHLVTRGCVIITSAIHKFLYKSPPGFYLAGQDRANQNELRRDWLLRGHNFLDERTSLPDVLFEQEKGCLRLTLANSVFYYKWINNMLLVRTFL
jgi:hypothetical protein